MSASPSGGVPAENRRISEEIGDQNQKSFKLVGDKYVGYSDIANNDVGIGRAQERPCRFRVVAGGTGSFGQQRGSQSSFYKFVDSLDQTNINVALRLDGPLTI